MDELATKQRRGRWRRAMPWLFTMACGGAAVGAGCGDGGDSGATATVTGTGGTTVSSSESSTTTSTGGSGGMTSSSSSTSSSGGGGSGGGNPVCATPIKGPTRGSAIALTPDDSTIVVANRDAGSVSIVTVDYAMSPPALKVLSEVAVGAEPWQVAIDGCGTTAYVVLRKDQKVVEITNITTNPKVGRSVAVGSEPTSLALVPSNKKIYVSNWVDGTLSVIDAGTMTAGAPIDLNATLAATNLLGMNVTPRPALAHPRGIAITNNDDGKDDDESILVSEFFAQRTAPETVATADTNWKGLVYSVNVGTGAATTVDLPPVTDTLIKDHTNGQTGCFPNMVQSVTINGGFAYVTSTCASPKGPSGVFQKGSCINDAGCGIGLSCFAGSCQNSCLVDADCGALGGSCDTTGIPPHNSCKANTQDVKTSTHPAVTIIEVATGKATTDLLDSGANSEKPGGFDALTADPSTTFSAHRLPLLPSDIDFVAPNFGYVTGQGADAVFRIVINQATGQISDYGAQSHPWINMRTGDMDKQFRLPVGIAISHTGKGIGFVSNDASRDVTAVDFASQKIAGGTAILNVSKLPDPMGTPQEQLAASQLKGKAFFTTGLGRWSLAGAGWGSCAACHLDGLTDNVTWYFGRGARQTISLDGTFSSKNGADQRILNWTAIFDEVADFELNTRNTSGGLGAIVDVNNARINLGKETPPQLGLMGSTQDVANPAGIQNHPHSNIPDWLDVTNWIKSLRSPRKPTNLVQADVDAGRKLFSDNLKANCIGCHSGDKWTISTVFYTPADGPNGADGDASNVNSLENKSWAAKAMAAGFPAALFPVANTNDAKLRSGKFPGTESIQCIMRPVGTFGVSDPAIGVLELRQDMTTKSQGSDTVLGAGFNPPSLLGLSVGAPYFHAGNARTLEEALNDMLFSGHHRSALAQVFTPDATTTKQLVAFMLSIDEDEPVIPIPAVSDKGGDFCTYP